MNVPNESTSDHEYVLSIESTATVAGVVLTKNGTLVSEYSIFDGGRHDVLLAELVRRTLSDVGISAQDLSAVALSAGPGSFTSLRIGAALVKGLLFGSQIPFIAVPSLRSFACAADEFAREVGASGILSVIYSHNDLVYRQFFDPRGLPTGEISIETIDSVQASVSDTTIVCGTGAPLMAGRGRQLSGLNRFSPRFVARLAAQLFRERAFTDIEGFVPLYVGEFKARVPG